jgi:hypothetical protein
VNVAETILVFVGIPLGIVVLLALLIFLPGGRKRPRYKSGQPWNHAPVWYEPHPEHSPAGAHGTPGHEGQTKAIGSSVYGEPADGASGHGSSAHGSSALGSSAHGASAHGGVATAPRRPAGPLGGARGTW